MRLGWGRDTVSLSDHERLSLAAAEDVIQTEREHIAGQRDHAGPWCGIGLSGGGIRSASLALGVLQALAKHDLLKRFQFISSVSGGGYIAASLQWWWSKGRLGSAAEPASTAAAGCFGVGPSDFPYGVGRSEPSDPPPAKVAARAGENLAFLRANASFLKPGHGMTGWAMAGVLLRTVIISVLTWLPLLTVIMLIVLLADEHFFNTSAHAWNMVSPFFGLIPPMWKPAALNSVVEHYAYRSAFAAPGLISYAIVVAFVGAALLFAALSRAPQDPTSPWQRTSSFGALALMVIGFTVSILANYEQLDGSMIFLLIIAVVFSLVALATAMFDAWSDHELNASYMLRRAVEKIIGWLLLPTIILLAVASIPLLPYWVISSAPATTAAESAVPALSTLASFFGLLAGVVSALYGYYTFLRSMVPSFAGHVAATVGAVIYIYGTLVLAYVLALALRFPTDFVGAGAWPEAPLAIRISIGFAIAVAAVIAFRGNINFVGLHRYYRDRLMEAFMPTEKSVDDKRTDRTPLADNLSIASLAPLSEAGLPYPIVNANVILVKDPYQKYASRGGDNFILSPLFVGSTATGWQRTNDFIKKNGAMTLPTAIAASGAAASANAGYIGTGITVNPLVSAVMSLMNIRLGLWVGNPFNTAKRRVRSIPTFLDPGLRAGVFRNGYKRDSAFVELTDGGHFENLALYELARRRLKVILIVDGEADPKIGLSSLVSAARRIDEDFGATIEFREGMGPEALMMYPPERGYPAGVRYAEAAFMVGRISYRHPTERDGVLIYIKSTLIKEMDFLTAGYLASNPEFPHQSTIDQFFDPGQFDAYRLLGFESANAAIVSLKLVDTIANHRDIDEAFLSARSNLFPPRSN